MAHTKEARRQVAPNKKVTEEVRPSRISEFGEEEVPLDERTEEAVSAEDESGETLTSEEETLGDEELNPFGDKWEE